MESCNRLQVQSLHKCYADKVVLAGLCFSLPMQGLYLLRGVSGSGKTTLLRILAGLEQPDSGSITGLAGKRISMVFQEHRLLPHFSALENVAFVSDANKAREVLTALELAQALDKKPSSLSGGMQRRVALARGLAYGGDLLLLDEPFNGLDAQLRQRILPHIRQFAQNALVLLACHDAPGLYQAQGEIHIP